jgi:hypothetical protein
MGNFLRQAEELEQEVEVVKRRQGSRITLAEEEETYLEDRICSGKKGKMRAR